MTTLSELQALTDDQLIEKVAVEVMGWRKITAHSHDGTGCWGFQDNGPPYTTHFDWNPLTDWNDTMKVVGALKQRDFPVRFENNPDSEYRDEEDGKEWHIDIWHRDGFVCECTDDPQRTLCIAALLAVS